jgi:outer membrane protein TolC
MKPRVCIIVASITLLCSAGFSQSVLVTEQVFPELQPILRAAVQQSPRMLERNLDLELAAGDRISARAGLYPAVNIYGRSLLASEKREDIAGRLSTEKLYYDISVNQSLFHWGDVRSRARMGDIREKIVQKQYAQGYASLAQEIRATYLRLIVQKVQLDAAKFAEEKAGQALAQAQERLRNRVISESEVFPIRINQEQASLGKEKVLDAFEETKRLYRLLTGVSAPADDAIPSTMPRMMTPEGEAGRLLAGFLSQKEPKTIATDIIKAQLEIERLNYSVSRHGLYPRFNLVAGISQDEQSYTTNIAQKFGLNSRYVGLSATWSVFDGFATRGAKMSSLARLRRLESNYKQLTEDLGTTAQRAARLLSFAERQMHIQDQLFGSTENFLTYRRDEFRRGTASEADIAGAQIAYNRELVLALQYRSEYLLRASDFLAAVMDDPILTNLPVRYR